jgi:hypothetical protein
MADEFAKLRQLQESDPEQFSRLIRELSSKNIRPHSGQQLVLDSKARFRVMNCGRRWGKTVLAAKEAIAACRKAKQMVWWVAPTYRITKRGYEEILRQLPEGVLAKPAPPSSNFDAGRAVILHFKNGTKLEFFSAERPEGMLGAAVDFCVMDEAAIMPSRIWNQVVSPTLIDHLGSALMISTPRGRNWFYDVWLKGQNAEEKDWASWTFTTQDNPTLPEGEADRMALDLPQMEADQEIYAKWIAAGSSVFILDERVIERRAVYENGLVEGREQLSGVVFLGVDLARTNDFTVMYGTAEKDRRNVYFERMNSIAWAEQRRRIKRAVRRLMRAGAEHVMLMVDEGNAGSVIVEDLEEAGFDVVGVNFTTHKSNMVRLLANDLERGKAFVLDECLNEFTDYAMTQTANGRMQYSAPDNRHDDVVSAKMLSHWGCVNEGMGDVQVITTEAQGDDQYVDPWDESDEDDFGDLLDPELDSNLEEDIEAAHQIGLDEPSRLTPNQLAARGWF